VWSENETTDNAAVFTATSIHFMLLEMAQNQLALDNTLSDFKKWPIGLQWPTGLFPGKEPFGQAVDTPNYLRAFTNTEQHRETRTSIIAGGLIIKRITLPDVLYWHITEL
jgi:hypothetical protein